MKKTIFCLLCLMLLSEGAFSQLCSSIEPRTDISKIGGTSNSCQILAWMDPHGQLKTCVCDKWLGQTKSYGFKESDFDKRTEGEPTTGKFFFVFETKGRNSCSSLESGASSGGDFVRIPWPFVRGCDD